MNEHRAEKIIFYYFLTLYSFRNVLSTERYNNTITKLKESAAMDGGYSAEIDRVLAEKFQKFK